jgi:predicted MFS family arabinose efflux permease
MNEMECGTLYSIAAGLTFFYGLLFSGYLIDNAGVKSCLLLGSFLLSIARILMVIVKTKQDLYLIMCTLVPMGMSLCNYNQYYLKSLQ